MERGSTRAAYPTPTGSIWRLLTSTSPRSIAKALERPSSRRSDRPASAKGVGRSAPPWRVLLLNWGIVATRSLRPPLMRDAFDRLLEHLPEDASGFFITKDDGSTVRVDVNERLAGQLGAKIWVVLGADRVTVSRYGILRD